MVLVIDGKAMRTSTPDFNVDADSRSGEVSNETNLLLSVIKLAYDDARRVIDMAVDELTPDQVLLAASSADFFTSDYFKRIVQVIEVDCDHKAVLSSGKAIAQSVLYKLGLQRFEITAPQSVWNNELDMLLRSKGNHAWTAFKQRNQVPAFELVAYGQIAA